MDAEGPQRRLHKGSVTSWWASRKWVQPFPRTRRRLGRRRGWYCGGLF